VNQRIKGAHRPHDTDQSVNAGSLTILPPPRADS
jgi:hypothetical protein